MAAVNIFNMTLRSEFFRALQVVPAHAPIDDVIQTVTSDKELERYGWLSPVPGVQEYQGHRRSVTIDPNTVYIIRNKHFDSSFNLLNEDIRRDQTAGRKFATKSTEMASKFMVHPRALSLDLLVAGATGLCFDGTAFFAAAHTIGTGDNLMAETDAGMSVADTSGDQAMMMFITDAEIKSVIYQIESGPTFSTDAGTVPADKAGESMWWGDLFCNAGYGSWHTAILFPMAGIPTEAEAQSIINGMIARFRTFKNAKAELSDPDEYPWEQHTFSDANTHVLTSTGIYQRFDDLSKKERLSTGESNIFRGRYTTSTSTKLDAISP